MTEAARVLYRNVRAWRVRVAQVAIWFVALGLPLVIASVESPPPTLAGLMVAGFGFAFLIGCAIGMEVYIRLYVLELSRTAQGVEALTLATAHHRRELLSPPGDADPLGPEKRDKGWYGGVSFDNQYALLKRPGRRLPLIVDLTAPNTISRTALTAALKSRPARERRDARAKRR